MRPPTSYAKKTLIPGEKMIYAAKLHNFAYFVPLVMMTFGVLFITLPFIIDEAKNIEQLQSVAENQQYNQISGKVSHHLGIVKAFLPEKALKFLQSANEVRQFFIGALFLFFGTFYGLRTFIKKISTEQVITNKKILMKIGFIKVDESEISLSNVESIKVFQSVFDRLIDRGQVLVNGVGMEQLEMRGVAKPNSFRQYAYTEWDTYINRHHTQHMQAENTGPQMPPVDTPPAPPQPPA